MNDTAKTALLILAVAVAGCLGGLKAISLGLKFFAGDKILTVPDNGIAR